MKAKSIKTQMEMIALFATFGLVLVSNASAKDTVLWQAAGSGRWAKVQFSDARNRAVPQYSDPDGRGTLSIYKTGSSAFLFYSIKGVDSDSRFCTDIVDQFGNVFTTCEFLRTTTDYGWGKIPPTSVQSTNSTTHLTLTTPTDFSSSHCVTVVATQATTCTPSSAVSFDLTWTSDSLFSEISLGTGQAFQSFSFAGVGTFRGSSASVSGKILGDRPVSHEPGSVGDSVSINVATRSNP